MGLLAPFVISPGNMDGGMTSIREKSLVCIVKAGSRPIKEVIGYGEIPTKKGVILLDGTGYDMEMVKRVLDGEQTKAEVNQQEGIVCIYTLHPAF